MSEENVAVVQRVIAALNDRDVDRYLAFCSPDVELVSPVAAIEGSSRGPEGIRQFFAGLDESTNEFRLDVERLQAVDEDRVLAMVQLRFTSQGGIQLNQAIANVYDLAGGKVRRVRVFLDRAKALEAAGLSE
jgi:ketosteroid isomerase-like protein